MGISEWGGYHWEVAFAGLHHVTLFHPYLQCVCSAKTPLPGFLVFPHLELVLLCVTVVAIAQVRAKGEEGGRDVV